MCSWVVASCDREQHPKLLKIVYRQAVDQTNLRCGQQQVKLLELEVWVDAADYFVRNHPVLDLVR